MTAIYPVETKVLPRAALRRERLLPTRGEVLVRRGDNVLADQVIGRCQLPGRVCAVDAGQALGVRREEAALHLRQAIGAPVWAGEVVAARGGKLSKRRQALSPVDGRVTGVHHGVILIETPPSQFDLRAQISGQVAHVLPERGVILSTVGALVQGVWGSGGEAMGHLELLVEAPDQILRAESISSRCQDTLIVGGWVLDEEPLERAVEARARGLILGSVPAEMVPLLRLLPCPTLVIAGFDRAGLPMPEKAFSILQLNAGREAALSTDRLPGWRSGGPELVIPLEPASGGEAAPGEELAPLPVAVGLRVRGLRAPYTGMTGTVRDLPPRPRRMESGCRLLVAEVEMDSGSLALIPLANLEAER